VRIAGTGLINRSSHYKQRVELRPCFLPAARLKPAPSGLSRSGCLATQGSAAHEPWAMKACPFRTSLGGMLLMGAERSVTRIDRGANQSELVLCPLERGFRMDAQRSGHGGPAALGRESRVEKVESRIRAAFQRNGHGGRRSRLAASDERDGLVIGRALRSTGCRAWLTQALVQDFLRDCSRLLFPDLWAAGGATRSRVYYSRTPCRPT
jgi:hypothetical protein